MANPQAEKGHMRIANDIWVAIIKRKFTLRQRNILDFILRMSWGCRKKSAVIPMLKDFELCGVRKEHIKIELEHLVNMSVLMWDSNRNEYSFNKDFDQWKVTPVKGWKEERFNELISMNLGYKVTETVTDLPNQQPPQNSNPVTKSVTQLPKKKLSYYKKRVTQLQKRQLESAENPCGSKDETVPKTILLKPINNIVITDNDTIPLDEEEIQSINPVEELEQHFLMRRGKGMMVSPPDLEAIQRLLSKGITSEVIKRGIDKAFDDFSAKGKYGAINSVRYCVPIIEELWARQRGLQVLPGGQNTLPPSTEKAAITEPEGNFNPEEDQELQELLSQLKTAQGG